MGGGTRSWRLIQEEILQFFSSSGPPPIHSTWESDKVIRINDLHCFMDESFWQRRRANVDALQASPMGNHLTMDQWHPDPHFEHP